jgi:hypothetical protein
VSGSRDPGRATAHLRHIVGGNRRRICERFAVMPNELGDNRDRNGLDDHLFVIALISPGDHAGAARLAKCSWARAPKLPSADGWRSSHLRFEVSPLAAAWSIATITLAPCSVPLINYMSITSGMDVSEAKLGPLLERKFCELR